MMMKKAFIVLAVFFLLVENLWLQTESVELRGTITISGAWALYPMALKWAEEFENLHPKVRVEVQAGGAGKGMADVLAGVVDIGSISRNIHADEISRGAFPIAVVRDAVVATTSAENPHLDKILKRGIKKEEFIAIWITEEIKTWGKLLAIEDKSPIHLFTRSDACGAAETWAEYLGKRQEDLKGVGIFGDPGLADAVRRDALAIGFNNINYAYDAKTRKPVAGLAVLPIDLDGNDRLDKEEDFYSSQEELIQAISRGVYPSPPARDLYFVTRGKSTKKIVREFLLWVLQDGQKYALETGYIPLSHEKLADQINKIKE